MVYIPVFIVIIIIIGRQYYTERKKYQKTENERLLTAKQLIETQAENEKLKDIAAESQKFLTENELLHSENQIAARIQKSMLLEPGEIIRDDNIRIYADIDFAKSVGGDFYDYFRLPSGKYCFYVADVSGKGVPAVSYMVAAKLLFRTYLKEERNICDVFATINKELFELSEEHQFITVFLGMYSSETSELEYINAGHTPGILIPDNSKSAPVLLSERSGLPVGSYYSEARADLMTYKSFSIRLNKGDTLILYTDGCTEAMNRYEEQLGQEAFIDIVCRSMEKEDIGESIRYIQRQIIAYEDHAEQDDDVTVIGVRVI